MISITNAYRRFGAALAITVFSACAERATEPAPEPAPTLAIIFSNNHPSETDVIVASLYRNGERVTPESPFQVTWRVDNPQVASIGLDGRLMLLAQGMVVVTAQVGDTTVSTTLAVQRLNVQSVRLGYPLYQLAPGDSVRIGVQVWGVGGRTLSDRAVTLHTDDPTIAVVETGRLRALRPGTTTLRAISEGVTGTAQVEVVAPDDR